MDLGGFKLFAALSRRMDWLGERQRVLAQNVANADTPGYRARDLAPLSFADLLRGPRAGRVELARTDPAHLAGSAPRAGYPLDRRRGGGEVTLSGNAVDLETELQKVGESAVAYQQMAGLYRKHLDLLRTAIGRTS